MTPEKMKYELREKGKTLTAIADEANVSVSTVSHVVSGRGRSKNVEIIIAETLNFPRESLFPCTNNPLYKRTSKQLQQSA